ncbi:hypothetical protein BKA83DRAFT_4496459 [Pisolithus microcarpus]|nr:hypothetical protein BKA83DRAFT_4496459 [Pisolithus microcarpus]
MDSNSASATGLILNLSGVHVLYATEHAFVTALWASTASSHLRVSSCIHSSFGSTGDWGFSMVFNQIAFCPPWPVLSAQIQMNVREVLIPLDGMTMLGNTVTFCVEYQAFRISFANSAMYWCFKYVTSCVAYRVRPSKYAYDEATLLDDFLQCKIPGQVPAGMPAPGPVEVATNTDREEAA